VKKLYRSVKNRMLAGLCGAFGEQYNVDPNLVRLAGIFAALMTGIWPLALTYAVAWVIIPEIDEESGH